VKVGRFSCDIVHRLWALVNSSDCCWAYMFCLSCCVSLTVFLFHLLKMPVRHQYGGKVLNLRFISVASWLLSGTLSSCARLATQGTLF
jgi:hypothetical protein